MNPTSYSSKKGITVLICAHNSEKKLPKTLSCLACQQVNDDLHWEVLMVNNCSNDNTELVATQTWYELGSPVPINIVKEKRKGKDNAIALGLSLANYDYIVICDDDNWLDERYLQIAFNIMEQNPEIGILGGKGNEECESDPPSWFLNYKVYYAVGEQHVISGELKHYWPRHRTIWGAGSIINKNAYNFLKKNGFKPVLNFKKSRSEDVELCFAMWLAGYKMWYDSDLNYKHFITDDRLKLSYLMKLIKSATSSAHHLKPYSILTFTGYENAPTNSFWLQYIIHYWKMVKKEFTSLDDLKILMRLIIGFHQNSTRYINKAIVFYQFTNALQLGIGYDRAFKKVTQLQSKMAGHI